MDFFKSCLKLLKQYRTIEQMCSDAHSEYVWSQKGTTSIGLYVLSATTLVKTINVNSNLLLPTCLATYMLQKETHVCW